MFREEAEKYMRICILIQNTAWLFIYEKPFCLKILQSETVLEEIIYTITAKTV